MKITVKSIVLLAALGLPGTLPAAEMASNTPAPAKPSLMPSDLFADTVVAKGKGLEVKRGQLDDEVVRRKAAAAAYGQTIPLDRMDLFERQVLDQVIGYQLLLAKATDADRAQGKEQFEKNLRSYKAERKMTDADFDEKLEPQLKVQGVNRSQWDKQQLEQATIPVVLERELKVDVTEADAKKFYDENPAKFEEPERVRVSHILISTKDPTDETPDPAMRRDLPETKKREKRKLAEDLIKRAKAGEDFTKLALENSDDPGVKQNKGEYKFSRDDPFVAEFKQAAFALNTNQISDIVTTVYGYHILKLWEKIPAHKAEFSTVVTNVTEYLKQQAMQKQLPDYMAKLKKDAGVEILDEKLKTVELPPPTALPPGHPAIPPSGHPPIPPPAKSEPK